MNIWKRITSCVLCAGLLLTPLSGVPEKPVASITAYSENAEQSVLMSDFDPVEQVYVNVFKYKNYGDHVVITGTTGTLTTDNALVSDTPYHAALVIPPDVNGVPVTEIGENAFAGQMNIAELIIPHSLKKIGKEAFQQCYNLYYLGSLSSKKESALEEIGYYAFASCFQAGKYRNSTMIDLTVFQNLKTIDAGAFHRCKGPITSVKLGSNVTSIGEKAFQWSMVYNFKVDEANPAYTAADGVLYTKDMTRLVQFPADQVKADFQIPSTVSSIASGAFAKAAKVKKVTIPESVTSIEDGAFYDCTILTIYGKSGSVAESYAKANNIPFVSTGTYTPPPSTQPPATTPTTPLLTTPTSSSTSTTTTSSTTSTTTTTTTTTPPTTTTTTTPAKEGKFMNDVSWRLDESGTLTVSGNGAMYDFDTNDLLSGSVHAPWATFRDSIRRVVIENGITKIGANAFKNYPNLTDVEIADTVTEIGGDAFYSTPWLKSMEEQNTFVIVNHILISASSFNCTGAVSIPDGVTTIADMAMSINLRMESVIIPASVKSIGKDAFRSCTKLSQIYIINPNCKIYKSASTFTSNAAITTYEFDGTIYGYKDSTAQSYAELYNRKFESLGSAPSVSTTEPATTTRPTTTTTSTATTPPEATTTPTATPFNPISGKCGENATWTLDETGTLTISGTGEMTDNSGLVKIAWDENKEFIKKIVISKGITSIGVADFADCTNLTSVTIPDSVTSIAIRAFENCTRLTDVTIPGSVTGIGFGAFKGCTSLTSVSIPDSVTSIGEHAFEHCSNLIAMTIPDGVTSIGICTFRGCTSLTSVSIPDSVTSIGYASFLECTNLTSVTIPGSVTSIADSAFNGCNSLTFVTILNPKCRIYNTERTFCNSYGEFTGTIYGYEGSTAQAYAQNYGYKFEVISSEPTPSTPAATTSASITTTVTTTTTTTTTHSTTTTMQTTTTTTTTTQPILSSGKCGENVTWTLDDAGTLTISGTGKMADYDYDSPFSDLKMITKVIIEPGVTSIGSSAFYQCENLTSVNIPDSVTSIEYAAFQYCMRLTSVTIPDSVTKIGNIAFLHCRNLTTLIIGNSVTSIGGVAFSGCVTLTSVTIPDSVTSIENETFNGCTSMTSVTILNPTCKIYNDPYTFSNGSSGFTGTIYGYEGSTAQAYAEKYGLNFEVVQDTPNTISLALPQDSIKLRAEKTYRIPQITTDLTYIALTPEIADVTANGLVMALAQGTASIKVTDSSGKTVILSVEVVPSDTNPYPLGNTNGDEAINAKDAATVLIAAARLGTGGATGFTDEQAISADVNNDGAINAKDANTILRYAAAVGTGNATNIKDYI